MKYAVFDAFWSLKNDTDDEQKFNDHLHRRLVWTGFGR